MAARPRPVKVVKKLEKDIEGACRDYAKSYEWLLLKFISPGNPGVQDRILISAPGVLYGPHVIFIEFKRPGEVPTRLQAAWHKVLERRGLEVWTIDSFAEFKSRLDDLRMTS